MISAAQLHQLAPNCDSAALAPCLDEAAGKFGIDTPLRVAHWLAQASHESAGFTRTVENLNYSAERLHAVWPGRFPSIDAATPFAHAAEKLANKVYGGRLGNDQSGDGWKFRGRGFYQLTGRENYARAATALSMPLLDNPDLLVASAGAAASAAWFWASRGLNEFADADDVASITRRINGGLVGLSERQALAAKAKAIWAA